MRCSALVWPMTGSTAARRLISRRIGFVTPRTWPLILKAHPHRQGEKMGEALPQRLVVADLAADIADHPTEPNAQELEFSPRPIELVGMGIAADHDRGALGHPTIALPQSHSSALGEIDQLLQRAMA